VVRALLWFAVCFAVLAHTWSVVGLWNRTGDRRHGADFASYYYAVQAAADGENPYDNTRLVALAKADGTRAAVYPYLYPPPFLLTMVWVLPLDLFPAYLTWFWLDELFGLLVGIVLWRWWKDMGPALPIVLLAIYGSWTIFGHNHYMGQVNLLVLAVTLAGLWLGWRGRDVPAGVLVGAACLFKMSPALFVLWWMTHRKWRAVGAAIATAVVLSVATLPLAGPSVQWAFYRDILPTFGSGDYGGLTVPISLFANHSLPGLYDRLFPTALKTLGPTAQALSTGTSLALAGGLLWAFRASGAEGAKAADREAEVFVVAGQVGAVCVAMLLVPVYTYEHHLVWVLPGLAAAVTAVFAQRLPAWCAVGVAYAWFVFALDIVDLQAVYGRYEKTAPLVATLVRESKLVGLLVVGAMCVWLGMGRGVRYAPEPQGEKMPARARR